MKVTVAKIGKPHPGGEIPYIQVPLAVKDFVSLFYMRKSP